jgi:hypothetical protein
MPTTTTPTIPELRRTWNYGRDGDESETALLTLSGMGQCGPDGKPCVWGTVIARHEVSDFVILETQRDESYMGPRADGSYGRIEPEEISDQRTFHVYVNGKNLGRSTSDLDSALLVAIAWKHEEAAHGANAAANSHAVAYIKRMIGMERSDA